MDRQLDLFAPPPPAPAAVAAARSAEEGELRAIAARLPPHVHFGTSSWTFPGWRRVVYHERYRDEADFVRRSLTEYTRHPLFGTVGVDRSYYAPIREDELRAYATQLPAGFTCVMKVWEGITTAIHPDTPRAGAKRGKPNEDFLSVERFEEAVAGPLRRAFADRVGVLVLELAPTTRLLTPRDVERRLETFFSTCSRDVPLAVELRDRRLLTGRYLELLRAYDVTPALNQWSAMPPLSVQLDTMGANLPGPVAVARLLLPPGSSYETEKRALAPFDRVQRVDPSLRSSVVRFVREAGERGVPAFVIVNNKVEGCSPLTIRALAELVAADHEARTEKR